MMFAAGGILVAMVLLATTGDESVTERLVDGFFTAVGATVSLATLVGLGWRQFRKRVIEPARESLIAEAAQAVRDDVHDELQEIVTALHIENYGHPPKRASIKMVLGDLLEGMRTNIQQQSRDLETVRRELDRLWAILLTALQSKSQAEVRDVIDAVRNASPLSDSEAENLMKEPE